MILNSLTGTLEQLGRLKEAEDVGSEGLAMGKRRLGAEHPAVFWSVYNLSSVLCKEGKAAEAAKLSRELLAALEEKRPDARETFITRTVLAECLLKQTNYAESERLLLAGYEGLKRVEHAIASYEKFVLRRPLQNLVELYEATNRPEQAAEWKKRLAEFEKAEATPKTAGSK